MPKQTPKTVQNSLWIKNYFYCRKSLDLLFEFAN